ncbi:hypothetical protein DPMN_062378 [Dreissena polymorpha]|uniref:Uncharacterized protein n=1 Tax=Dreissena polymorpha TaxID=45954 RepID=A0A9D4HK55_DREPO|nr:hypothetical protein DPMN_062378 [Dreissena polymorpha]
MLGIINILMTVNVIGGVLFVLHRRYLYRLELRTRIKGCINLRSYTGIKKYSVNSQSKNKTQPMNCLLGDTNTNIDVESAPTCRVYFLNEISDHFVDSETQTGVISQTNKKNVFGQPYTHRVLADESNATVNIPNSESRMTLPLSELRKHPIEVHCCSFDCIRLIRHKMDISDDVDLASPTVEYLLPGYAKLCDYAVVVLPFIGDPSQLRVWKFQSAEGQHVVSEKVEVPLKTKINEHMDAYYEVDGNKVHIYTKSFSGFYCTITSDRLITMTAFVYGSYKKIEQDISPRREVRLRLFILDEIFMFMDYKKNLDDSENKGRRRLITTQVLLTPFTTLEERLLPDDQVISRLRYKAQHWTPIRVEDTTEAAFEDEQVTELHIILKTNEECHQLQSAQGEPGFPIAAEWYLCARPEIVPQDVFQCMLDVDVYMRCRGNERKHNRIAIDEWHLLANEKLPIEVGRMSRSVHSIKEYFASNPAEFARIRLVLQRNYNVNGNSAEDLFEQLQITYQPQMITRAVIEALREARLDHVINTLYIRGILTGDHVNNAVQPVNDPENQRLL